MDRHRLTEAMKRSSMSQSDLARAINVTQGAIHQIVTGRTSQTKHLPAIARALGVSVDWLEGHDVASGLAVQRADTAYVQLTEVDVGFGMGGGTFLDDTPVSTTSRVFDPKWLREVTLSPPGLLFVARGVGDSMMPTLLDNDTLLIDRGQKEIVQQDRIWALTYGELGTIKRVRRTPQGVYLLMSDNPAVSPIEASRDEFNVVGRLVWVGRKQ